MGQHQRPMSNNCDRLPRKRVPNNTPASSAMPVGEAKQKNLTLHDWLTVFAYVDQHTGMSQSEIVEHFHTRHKGTLVFTQATLSRRLADHNKMEK